MTPDHASALALIKELITLGDVTEVAVGDVRLVLQRPLALPYTDAATEAKLVELQAEAEAFRVYRAQVEGGSQ